MDDRVVPKPGSYVVHNWNDVICCQDQSEEVAAYI